MTLSFLLACSFLKFFHFIKKLRGFIIGRLETMLTTCFAVCMTASETAGARTCAHMGFWHHTQQLIVTPASAIPCLCYPSFSVSLEASLSFKFVLFKKAFVFVLGPSHFNEIVRVGSSVCTKSLLALFSLCQICSPV